MKQKLTKLKIKKGLDNIRMARGVSGWDEHKFSRRWLLKYAEECATQLLEYKYGERRE